VKLEAVVQHEGKLFIRISGIDLLDGTPVLDIKPYVPYVDCILEAENQFAPTPPEPIPVDISSDLIEFCMDYQKRTGTELAALICQILRQDPRPQYQQPEPERVYGMKLLDLDVRWRYLQTDNHQRIQLTALLPGDHP
jgi:hypothetical protein